MSEKSLDKITQTLLEKAREEGVRTWRDRLDALLPQCGFGELGICCRMCYMGPCRIDPFGLGPDRGVCGATADTIVCRNLLREAVGGAASHSDHAREVALLLKEVAEGKAQEYQIKDKEKLMTVAKGLDIKTKGRKTEEVALDVAHRALEDFGRQDEKPMNWLKFRAPTKEYEMWEKLGLLISSANNEIANAIHRTTMGNDADPVNLLLGTLRMGLVDGYAGLTMATDLQDILFGTPALVHTAANLGTLKEEYVNLAVHGHNPILSEKIVEWAAKMQKEAKNVGAKGVNVVGICCTGNEVLMRHGIALAAHNIQAELAIVTGALEAMVVDIQCIWPSLADVAACYHTKLITTVPFVKIPGATHIEFSPEHADESARKIVQTAIDAFKNRNAAKIWIPKETAECYAGFSVETIVGALSKVNPQDPLKPVIDNIVKGNIYGAVGIVGCPNPKLRDHAMHERMTMELLRKNVLVVVTGCAGHVCAQAGLLNPKATEKYCGNGLKAVLTAVGNAAGLKGPLPPVWHMGSCVDNSRIGVLLAALADKLNVKISQLPVAASAPELITEKAISIGVWALALGLLVHVAPVPHTLGSPMATKVLTEELPNITGGKIYVEYDPEKAATGLVAHIAERRKALGI